MGLENPIDHDPKRVAVLIGPMTASSGENVLMGTEAIPGASVSVMLAGAKRVPRIYLLDGPTLVKLCPLLRTL